MLGTLLVSYQWSAENLLISFYWQSTFDAGRSLDDAPITQSTSQDQKEIAAQRDVIITLSSHVKTCKDSLRIVHYPDAVLTL